MFEMGDPVGVRAADAARCVVVFAASWAAFEAQSFSAVKIPVLFPFLLLVPPGVVSKNPLPHPSSLSRVLGASGTAGAWLVALQAATGGWPPLF